jgi:hypothetical protein
VKLNQTELIALLFGSYGGLIQLLPMLAMPVFISVARIMVRLILHLSVLDVRVNLNAVLFAGCCCF